MQQLIRFVPVLALWLLFLAPQAADEKVAELNAFFREGQTFITWKEVGDAEGEKYRIYRSDAKITPANLDRAALLATVPEGSCVFRRELKKKFLERKTGVEGYGQRFCIVDNPTNDPGKMLPQGTGLFVHTAHEKGPAFYAVVPEIDGEPRPDRMAALDASVSESVMLPGAVLQWKHPDGTAAVYTHWMDRANWDPFNEGTAYNFGVAVPEKYNGKDPLPVMYYGHGMGGGYRCSDKASYWRCLWIWHGDESGSWFFGVMNRDKTRVVNYVERRVRWSFEWLQAGRPNQFFRVNPKRVQAHGHSMGGTMSTAFALRLGDIFCSTVSSAGATIHRRNRTWVRQAARLWGPVEKNLPTPDGTGVWDHQDYAQWSLKHMGQETAFLLISNGKRDGSVVFEPVPDFLNALQKSKRPFAAHWNMRGHSWSAYGVRNERMGAFRLPLDESLPAFGNASNNGDPRKDKSGTINGNLEWSASGNDFDKGGDADDIVDTAKQYGVNLRSLTGPATVDVTPRRLQHFKPQPGKTYAWENLDFSDPKNPKVIDRGVVQADKYGLVTVERFKVSKKGLGNRLVIRPAKP
jgi:hypothetical protein